MKKYRKITSGMRTILGQGGQGRERQSRDREKFFAEIGVFFSQKQAFSKKKIKKGLRRIWSVFLSQKQAFCLPPPKKGLRRIRSVYLPQKWPRIQVSGGAKVAQGGPKFLQGGRLPPTSRAYENYNLKI